MLRVDTLNTACTGVILAGGLNKRFSGQNKALLKIGDRRIIDNIIDMFTSLFEEIILVTNQPMDYLEWDVNIVTDIFQAQSSLTGIHAGLFYASNPFVFVTACDTPFLKKELVEFIVSEIEPKTAVVIPETSEGTEQLSAVYSKTCLSLMEKQVLEEIFQIKKMFRKVRVKKIPEKKLRAIDPQLMSFFNINTDADYLKAKEWIKSNGEAEPV